MDSFVYLILFEGASIASSPLEEAPFLGGYPSSHNHMSCRRVAFSPLLALPPKVPFLRIAAERHNVLSNVEHSCCVGFAL